MATKKPGRTAKTLLRGLAWTRDDKRHVASILTRAKVGAGRLKVGKTSVEFGPPGDPDEYEHWPASFREFIATIRAIRIGDSLTIGEDLALIPRGHTTIVASRTCACRTDGSRSSRYSSSSG